MQYMTEQEIDNIASETGRLKRRKSRAHRARRTASRIGRAAGISSASHRTPVSVPESWQSGEPQVAGEQRLRAFEDVRIR